MDWRKISGLLVLGLGLATSAVAASQAALADAVEKGDKTSVRQLLGSGVDANAAQVDGTTALHWAAYREDAETVALLVRAGANVNAMNRYGVPPLAQACTNGNAAIVKQLLEAGADANATIERRGIRPHVGGALRECRGGEDAPRARRQARGARTARPDGVDVGGGRGAHRSCPRFARCRS
jgi:Ankyrin repeats (3 copies)